MGIVNALAPEVYSKIAAGEVVERPLSVVKELLENSLDAGASFIRIELEEGGKKKIRVRDDGSGFFPEDIGPAFSCHSTSKLVELDDFDRLTSLGFRGEALPSIAQVSRVTLVSSTSRSGLGMAIRLDSGGEISREETVCPKGTDLTVSDLFYNFPVRKRFLKSERAELNAVLRYVEQLALAYWTIGFSLSHNDRDLFSFPAVNSLQDRIYQVFGREFLDGLMPLETSKGQSWRLRGWVSKPGKGGRDRQRQFFFVNGRNVREKTLMAAFNQAYAGSLEKGYQAQGILLIELPGHEIDVNIHPMKLEIKFADNQAVFAWIYRSLMSVLREKGTSSGDLATELPASSRPIAGAVSEPDSARSFNFVSDPFEQRSPRPDSGLYTAQRSSFRLLGQFLHSYVVVEKEGELLLVDQHNAHETVIYHRLQKQIKKNGRIPSAVTLFPVLCELSPREWAQYEERKDDLGKLGYDLEPLGERALSIRAYPAEIRDSQARDTLLALLCEEVTDEKSIVPGRLATIACKSAIKVNHPLHDLEMVRLLDDFFQLEQRDFCPHGRPVVVALNSDEIEKRLKRR